MFRALLLPFLKAPLHQLKIEITLIPFHLLAPWSPKLHRYILTALKVADYCLAVSVVSHCLQRQSLSVLISASCVSFLVTFWLWWHWGRISHEITCAFFYPCLRFLEYFWNSQKNCEIKCGKYSARVCR